MSLASAPPCFFQAAVSLYIDGIKLEAVAQANFAAFFDDFTTASMAEQLVRFFGTPDINSIEANIAFLEPYAGPFGPYLVQAGEQAVDQILPHRY
jgi:hypothetical protein